MKKAISTIFCLIFILTAAGCTKETGAKTPGEISKLSTTEDVIKAMKADVRDTIEAREAESSALLEKIDGNLENYQANKREVEEWYASSLKTFQSLTDRLTAYSEAYYKIMFETTDLSDYDKFNRPLERYYRAFDRYLKDAYTGWDYMYTDLRYELEYACNSSDGDFSAWEEIYSDHLEVWEKIYSIHNASWDANYTMYITVGNGLCRGITDLDTLMKQAKEEIALRQEEK